MRYSTTGVQYPQNNVQPMITEFLQGRIATAHNGNIVNAGELREKLVYQCGCSLLPPPTDSEVISSLIAWEALRGESVRGGGRRTRRDS